MNKSGSGYGYIETLENRTLFSGGLDPTWGTGGYISAPAGQPLIYSSIKTLSNRKVLAAGVGNNGGNPVFELKRYNVDGTVDDSFGSNGVAQTAFGNRSALSVRLLIQPDGKIVAAGNVENTLAGTPVMNIGVARFNSNGTLDKSFGSNGTILFVGDENPTLHWQAGKLLIGSNSTIRRLNSNGTLDGSFLKGVAGEVAMAVQPDGKILTNVVTYDMSQFVDVTTVRRYNANGSVDTTFGNHGEVITPNPNPLNISADQIVVESSGTILLLDSVYAPFGPFANIDVFALNPNGSLDSAFGIGGTIDSAQGAAGAGSSLIQQNNGQLLLVVNGDANFIAPGTVLGLHAIVTRYSSTGQLDTAFGNGGTASIGTEFPSVYRGNGPLTVGSIAALDSAGRLVITGGTGPNGANIFAIDTNNDTGTITGYMFYDTNGNGKRDPGEGPLNWTCYIDVDNDGHYDNADIRIYTDAAGHFTIPNLAPGVYHIRQSQVSHWQKTTPAEYTVTVTTGTTITGINFGSRFIG